MAEFCFARHLIHEGQHAGPGTDYKVPAVPRNVLFDGERCVAEIVAELLGSLLPALADATVVDDDVMLVGDAVDANGVEGKRLEAHGHLRANYILCAQMRSYEA